MNKAFSNYNYLKGADFVSDTLSVCGLTICRGSKLRTMLPVPGTEIEISAAAASCAPCCLYPALK